MSIRASEELKHAQTLATTAKTLAIIATIVLIVAIVAIVAKAGSSAIYAMIALIIITPNLTAWVNRQGGFELRIEPEYIGMLAFAVFVCAVGRVLAAATDIKSENDAFV
jgi:hypothetical protein